MTKTDEDAIREIELQFNEAWGRHNADDMVVSLSDDAQFVTVNFMDKDQGRLSGLDDASAWSQRAVPNEHPRNADHACTFSCARCGHDALTVPHLWRY